MPTAATIHVPTSTTATAAPAAPTVETTQPPAVQAPATEMVSVYLRVTQESNRQNYRYQYDQNGYLTIRYTTDLEGTPLSKVTYRYDNRGNLIYESTASSYKEYHYNSSNRKIETYDSYFNCRYTYEYDINGNLINEIYYADNKESSRREWTYDQQNRQLTEREISNGQEQSRVEYQYDSQGNQIRQTYFTDNTVDWYETYQYDGRNHLVCVMKFSDGKEVNRKEFTYDSSGNLTKTVEWIHGKEYVRDEFFYDHNGNCVTTQHFWEGIERFRWDYTYDEHGNLIREVYSDYNETRFYIYSYTLYQMPKQAAENLLKLYTEQYLDSLIHIVP